ncbi:MAG: ABC transporter substrate-binding protein [Flavobacteriales bacterium]
MLHYNSKNLSGKHNRIISVVPSLTELLFDLGLKEEVVGITKFCIHPDEWLHSKTRIGGTKQLNIEAIKKLNPDLIIANKEENEKEQILELAKDFDVLLTDIKTLDDALIAMYDIGKAVGKEKEALQINSQIQQEFEKLIPHKNTHVAYLIWRDPYMSINRNTFIHHLMALNGWQNVFGDHNDRYPMTDIEIIREKNPEYIFLSSEPFPFAQKHADEIAAQLPECKVILVDGEMFSWYGSRLKRAVTYFHELNLSLNKIQE